MSGRPLDLGAFGVGLLLLLMLLGGCSEEGSPSTHHSPRQPGEPGRVLVAYWTRSGNTKTLAEAVAEGARSFEGTTVTLSAMADVTAAELAAAEGIVVGTPTHFGGLPGEAKLILDRWALELGVDFTDKVGGAFATGGDVTGGKEHVVSSLHRFLLANRMILVGLLHEADGRGWGEMGASATTGAVSPGVQEAELDSARKLGRRVADLAQRIIR